MPFALVNSWRTHPLLWACGVLLLSGSLHFAILGYTGYVFPVDDNLPWLHRQLTPNVLQADFHAQASAHSNPRQVFASGLLIVSKLLGGDPMRALTLSQLLICLFGPFLQFLFFRTLLRSLLGQPRPPLWADALLLAAVVFMQLGFYSWQLPGIVGSVLYRAYLFFRLANFDTLLIVGHAQTWGALLSMLGCTALLLRGKATVAFWVLALVGGLLHPVAGLMVCSATAAVLVATRQWRQLAWVLGWAALLPALVIQLRFAQGAFPQQAEAAAYYLQHHSYHYLPSTFTAWQGIPHNLLIWAHVFAVITMGALLWLRKQRGAGMAALLWGGLLAVAWLAQYYLAERQQLLAVIYLGPSRFLSMAFWFECLALMALLYTLGKPAPNPSSSIENLPSPWPLRTVAALAMLLAGFFWFQSTRQPLQHSPQPQLAAYLSKQLPADYSVAWHDRLLPKGRALRNLSLVSAFVSSDFPFYVPAIPEYALRREAIARLEQPTPADVALLRKGKVSHVVLPDTMVADTATWRLVYHAAPCKVYTWQ